LFLRPRGPRSGSGYSVPVRHHLIDPIRPTRGHTAISPHGGTEDLDVKVSKEALTSAIRSRWCSKGLATGHGRPQGQEGRSGLEAIARHCHAAITRGGDDCRHDAGDGLAAALGAWARVDFGRWGYATARSHQGRPGRMHMLSA